MMLGRRREPVQGVQYGSGNEQQNFFAPVTKYLFSGGFERLGDVCFDPAPLARDLDLARFTGREWLINQIDAFIKDRARGYVIIQAEAGVGKSTLVAHLAWTRPWLCHFTRLPGGRSPEAARKSLAAQLIAGWDLLEWAPEGVLPTASSRPDWFSRLLEAAARKRDEQEPDEEHRKPIVIMVDGLDEAEPEPGGTGGRGLPLGLPENLPDRVYVVATSRFGIDRALHAVRNPADWLQIEVEGADNLDDMRRFLQDVTSPEGGDARLVKVLRGGGVEVGWFRVNVAQSCAGVWIYLRYVLDEIRDGMRSPRSVGDLPGDLAGFYAEEVERWRGAAEDEAAQRRWEQVRLPLLGVLGAARAPLTVAELATFAAVPSLEAVRVFIEETIRAFLSRRDDPSGEPRWALRHQSLRDLLTGNIPSRPDLESAARMLAARIQAAHRQITSALVPPGRPGERDWGAAGSYARQHLAAHAASCGELDALVNDPGFLVAADPGAVLAQRARLCTLAGKQAMAAFDLGLNDWDSATLAARLDRLAANAARVRAATLDAACAIAGSEWPVRWAAWTGQGHRRLPGHKDSVNAVAIGRAGDREIIVSGSADATVRIWDAVTGDPVGALLRGHDGPVRGVAIGPAGDREIIVSGSADGTVRIWDAVTGSPLGLLLASHDGEVNAVAIGQAGDRHIIVSGARNGVVWIWDAVTGAPVELLLAGEDGEVNTVAIGRAGDREIIMSGAGNGTVRIWDAVTAEAHSGPSGTIFQTGLRGGATSLAIGRAGDRDVVAADSYPVRVWDTVTGALAEAQFENYHWMTALAMGRAGNRDVIVAGSEKHTVRVWDAVTGRSIGRPLVGHDGAVNAVVIGRAADRDIIVSGSADRTVRIWDAVTDEFSEDLGGDLASAPLVGHDGPILAVAIGRAGDREIIVSGSADAIVRVWDAVTGDPAPGPETMDQKDPVNAVAIGRVGDRDIIVYGSGDHTVRIWDAVAGDPVGTLYGHDESVRGVAIGRAGDREIIVSGSDDRTVRIWDAVTGDPVGAPFTGHDGVVFAVAIGRPEDREIIVSGSGDRTVLLRQHRPRP
jgi:WD40 repeat protein